MATDPMMTSQVLRTLEQRCLIDRSPHPQDGRAQALTLTRRGRSLVNRAIAAVEQCDEDFFRPLGPARAFTRALLALRDR